jgi:hypothetical protein
MSKTADLLPINGAMRSEDFPLRLTCGRFEAEAQAFF